ncbi:prophage endopeptidase tail family protein [Bacillus altitudinis]|uniref:prophage endopeptidase tail family protein n=1 Tax=Bacillus altitudinis TaxID=293387 RepID=UPI0025AB3EBA|nr:prophage endopeptidase tail family protein [Bacillus altitudinis]MDN0040573.1 prophage endopeptidase tail family protein [Bacillus aerophilus]WLF28875.1 prophage endopeptidase tail family protein [Bacillus altitudinis]
MAEMFILSPEDELLAVLSSDGQDSCNFWDAKYKEELNLGSSFSFIADASHPDARYLFEENQVVFRDKDGELRAFVIKELDDTDDGAELNTLVTCEAAMMELAETIIKEKRPKDKTAQYVLDQVFERTRWTAEVTAELGLNSTSFYKMNALECLSDVLNKWGGEFKDVVEFDGNTITKRTIKVLSRRGKDSGKRFEIDKDTESIRRTVISYPKTALYGYGASLETTDDDGEETGGYSRFIDFADVEWKKANGDPVDKPKGQEWVGDPALLQKYGRLKNGELIHREDIFNDEDIEDPEELLKATYNHLITVASITEVNYELSVKLLEGVEGYEHEHVDLGDTTIAIDRNFAIPIETSQRIIVMEYDITDPENTCVVEIGQFLSALQGDDRVKQLQKIIDSNRGTWERKPEAGNVTDGSFPNTKPPRPANIKVEGLYKTISLTWDYDPRSFIAAYEVYASQNKGFTPTAAQLIFRGKTGGWHHQDGVEADQVWYYRLRTINTHGTASDWSEEYEAKTVRILTDDIMFGAVTADKLAALSVTADKLYTDISNSNILPGSLSRPSDLAGLNSAELTVNEQDYNEVTVTKKLTDNMLFGISTSPRKSLKLVNGETYTFSIEVKRGNLKNFNYLNFRYYVTPGNLKRQTVETSFGDISNLPSDEFVRLNCTFTYTGDTASNYYLLFGAYTENASDEGTFVFRNLQLRMGETIKEWSASPFDVMLTEKSITSVHINDAAINSAHISNAAIGSAAIANAAIQKAHLGTAIIDTAHIIDGAITNAKIANLSADKITAGTIKGITIEGSLIKGARIEPISQNSRYKSYITADEIYQEYTKGTTNVLTIKDGVFKQSFKDDNKEVVGGTTIDKGFITLEGGSGLSVLGKETYRFYLFSDFIDGSGFKMTEYNGSTERDLFSMTADTLDLTITSNEETIINSVGTNYYIKGNGQYYESTWSVSKDGNFAVDVDNGYFCVFAKKGFIISTLDGSVNLNAHTIDMYSGNQTRTLLRAAGVWLANGMNSLQTNCQIIFDKLKLKLFDTSIYVDYKVPSDRNVENLFHVFLQVEGGYSSLITLTFENKTTSGFRITLRNVSGNASANNREYTVNIMMITEAI